MEMSAISRQRNSHVMGGSSGRVDPFATLHHNQNITLLPCYTAMAFQYNNSYIPPQPPTRSTFVAGSGGPRHKVLFAGLPPDVSEKDLRASIAMLLAESTLYSWLTNRTSWFNHRCHSRRLRRSCSVSMTNTKPLPARRSSK